MVRIAVVGAGPFVGMQHCAAVRGLASRGVELACVCQRRKNDTAAASHFKVPLYTNVAEMASREQLHGVVIAAPTHDHLPLVESCIKGAQARQAELGHGRLELRALLVEKPICEDLPTAMRLVDLAEKAGIKILVGHHRRHSAYAKRARDLVASPEFGPLRGMTGEFAILKPESYFAAPYRRQKGKGGPLLVNLVHDIDLLRYITGREVAQVFTFMSSAARNHECEDTGAVTLVMDHGAVASFFFSDVTPSPWNYEFTTGENPKYPPNPGNDPKDCYHFLGAFKSLGFPSMRLFGYDSCRGDRAAPAAVPAAPAAVAAGGEDAAAMAGAAPATAVANGPAEPGWDMPMSLDCHAVAREDPLENQMAHFVDVCQGTKDPVCSGRDAMETLAVVAAIVQSSETQTPVRPMDIFRTSKRMEVIDVDLPEAKSRRVASVASTVDCTNASE